MENRILNIETYNFNSNIITFAGTLRNEKKFDLFQKVFIKIGDSMCQCKVVGVELPPKDNADYIYKIELPKDLISNSEITIVSLICDHIFSTIDEAKESAMKELELKYQLNKDNIIDFFKYHEIR